MWTSPPENGHSNGHVSAAGLLHSQGQGPRAGSQGIAIPLWSKRTLLTKTEVALGGLLEQLDQVADQCSQHQQAGGGPLMNEEKFQASPARRGEWLGSRWVHATPHSAS